MPYSVDFLSILEVFSLYELSRASDKKEPKVKVSQGADSDVNAQIATADKYFTILLLNLTFDVLITFIILFLFLIPDLILTQV